MVFRLIATCLLAAPAAAQFDPGKQLNVELGKATDKKVQVMAEAKQRFESRTGAVFGRDRDLAADFVRLRLGLMVKPLPWIKAVGLAQDTRAGWYGAAQPGNVRDPLDLQEGYVELFSEKQQGLGFSAGRQMLGYGDTRLIGSPQWAYTARTWDTARLYHVSKRARIELLHLSTIVPNRTDFNRINWGDRIFGTYNTFRNLFGGATLDAYVLRHRQNRSGGFTGVGTVGINLFGQRWQVPVTKSTRAVVEAVTQTGHVGPQKHRALGWVGLIGYKRSVLGKPVDFANEYKYASGTDPASGRSGTFDQLYPAAHDKLGHIDLLGWRNIHNIRSVTTLTANKRWNWVLMYNASWLANPRDALYNAQGRAIVRSANGSAGRWVGQEIDLYSGYQYGSLNISAGIGQFIPGTFVQRATPGAHSRLLYLSTAYSF